jgi:hypothetical protein
MKKNKDFDCVEMKNELQARLAKKYEGLSDEEIARRRKEWLEKSDDPLAKWWRSIPISQSTLPTDSDIIRTH